MREDLQTVTLIEEKRNIFELDPKKYYFAHCISSDCKMGAGIAVEFKKRFRLSHLKETSEDFRKHPTCIMTKTANDEHVFNLITKRVYHGKPTYDTMKHALLEMKGLTVEYNIKYIAMPKIGCGLDRLQWGKVREIINEVFKDVDVEIRVCYL